MKGCLPPYRPRRASKASTKSVIEAKRIRSDPPRTRNKHPMYCACRDTPIRERLLLGKKLGSTLRRLCLPRWKEKVRIEYASVTMRPPRITNAIPPSNKVACNSAHTSIYLYYLYLSIRNLDESVCRLSASIHPVAEKGCSRKPAQPIYAASCMSIRPALQTAASPCEESADL
jgi:hypothetical protein